MTEEKIPFAGNVKLPDDVCEEAFFARFPDFFYEGSTALTLWKMSWEASREALEVEKPRIALI